MSQEELFNVCVFYPNDTYEYVVRYVDAETAVRTAKSWTERPAARIGAIKRVIITDGGDSTNFEWIYGEGITYPRRDADGKFTGD